MALKVKSKPRKGLIRVKVGNSCIAWNRSLTNVALGKAISYQTLTFLYLKVTRKLFVNEPPNHYKV